MKHDPHLLRAISREFGDWQLWWARMLVIAAAAAAGLTVVAFTAIAEHALKEFQGLRVHYGWLPWVWTPLSCVCIVWLTRRFVPGAAGSGIPQVMAALDLSAPPVSHELFVSLRLSVTKIALTSWGLLAGLSLGREGPSVQIAAGVMHAVRRWLPRANVVEPHGLLVAGGAAGIAAAFNTPLGGIMFAIEELTRSPEKRGNGLLMASIVLAGMIAVSINGNATYFGVIRPGSISWDLLLPGLLVAVCTGAAGGLFSRALIAALSGKSRDPITRFRAAYPILFAGLCGLVIALIGWATSGVSFGSGYTHTRLMLEGEVSTPAVYVVFKFLATLVTAWSGVPGGIFAPCLAIGAALGNDIAILMSYPHAAALIALGMAGFLAAATQAPLTAFIIVMEMVDGHEMVLSLMACTLVASFVARLLSPPLYSRLAQVQLARIPEPQRLAWNRSRVIM